jgi:hypothetical protein
MPYADFGTIFVTTFEVSGGFLKAGTWVSDFTEASRNWILNFLRKKQSKIVKTISVKVQN